MYEIVEPVRNVVMYEGNLADCSEWIRNNGRDFDLLVMREVRADKTGS
jgi:hypothetical protein